MSDKIFIGIDDQIIEAEGEILENLLAEQALQTKKTEEFENSFAAKEAAKKELVEKLDLSPETIKALFG